MTYRKALRMTLDPRKKVEDKNDKRPYEAKAALLLLIVWCLLVVGSHFGFSDKPIDPLFAQVVATLLGYIFGRNTIKASNG